MWFLLKVWKPLVLFYSSKKVHKNKQIFIKTPKNPFLGHFLDFLGSPDRLVLFFKDMFFYFFYDTLSSCKISEKTGSLRPATLLKKRLWHRCFPVNFAKFLRTPFLNNTSGRLLLHFWNVALDGWMYRAKFIGHGLAQVSNKWVHLHMG